MARYSKENTFFLPVHATVAELELTDAGVRDAIQFALARQRQAFATTASAALLESPIDGQGRPKMLQVVGWMCHAPEPNLNAEAFRPQDLEALAAQGLFNAPYFGAIDENHDMVPRGAWYSAEWAYDTDAKQYGLLVKGAIWAWAFPDFAARLLKQQQEQGYLNVSMFCAYAASEQKVWDDGRSYKEIHNPIFLACSAITTGKPGDADANGYAFPGGDWFDAEYVAQVLKASLGETGEADTQEDITMNLDELMKKMEALLGEQKAELQPLVQAVAKLAETEATLVDVKAQLASAQAATQDEATAKAALESKVVELEGQVAAFETERATAAAALETAKAEIQSMTEELETLRTFKATSEAEAAQAAKDAVLATRKAEMPEQFAEAVRKQENGEALLQQILEAPEEQWQATKAMFAITPKRKSMAERSAEEGLLPSLSEPNEKVGRFKIAEFARK